MINRNRVIDEQLIKPIKSKNNQKGKINIFSLQKEFLSELNVPYFDNCCDNNENIPVRYNGSVIQYYDSTTNTWITISTGGGSAYTVSNGLHENPANNFKLGGVLIENTDINTAGAFNLTLRDTGGTTFGLRISPTGFIDVLNNTTYLRWNTTRIFGDYGHSTSVFVGKNAGNVTGTGTELTGVGEEALVNHTGPQGTNTAIGYRAMFSSTNTFNNVAVGSRTLYSIITSPANVNINNVAIGNDALTAATNSDRNVAVGTGVAQSCINASTGFVGVGYAVMRNGGNIGLSTNTTLIGNVAGYNLHGVQNTGVGAGALGKQSIALTGIGNTGVGFTVMTQLRGNSNYNTAIGWQAGVAFLTTDFNIAIGYSAGGVASTVSGSNNILIGNNSTPASGIASFQLNIGNAIYGTGYDGSFTTLSNARTGFNKIDPQNRVEIYGEAADTSGLRFTRLTSAYTPIASTGYALDVDANGDVIRVTAGGGGGGSQAGIQFKDEGVNLGAANTVDTINFVGANVVASRASNTITITVTGAAGSSTSNLNVVTHDYNGVTYNTASGVDYQVAFTGAGVIPTTVNISAGIIGDIFVISDLDRKSSTTNITIDAGAGNTIASNVSAVQTFILNIDGGSVTLQKITSTKWKII